MNETVQETLVDTLDYLMTLVREGTRPEEARSGILPLQTRHNGVTLQLISEEETYDHSIHYDALLSLPGSGTISLSYCDDRAMPWPLRGVHRWRDADVVRVNNNVLAMDQAIACLDFIWDEARITDRLVNLCLIQEELEKDPIDVSDEELQRAMDDFRRARKLHKAEDTYSWMERRGITHADLERLVRGQATISKLRDKVVASRAQDYFDAHAADFDTAFIARFLLPDEASALDSCERLRRGETNFFAAAQARFIAKPVQGGSGDLFSALRRRETPADIRASLFEAVPGSVLGPVREENGYAIIQVLSIVPAEIDESTRNTIKNVLFAEWLEERHRAANIEWFWGNVSRTAQNARTGAPLDLSFAGQ